MLGFYNYTVILTYISLCISMVGIHFAINDSFVMAFICLLLSGFCDAFDGPVARTKQRNREEQEFGIQIDSLTDLICFGVFPSVIAYSMGMKNTVCIMILLVYVLCAMIRLAYFNVQETSRQQETTEKRKYYSGLPVTTVALIFPFIYCLKGLIGTQFMLVYTICVILVAMLFVLDIKVKKAGKIGMGLMLIVAIGELVVLLGML